MKRMNLYCRMGSEIVKIKRLIFCEGSKANNELEFHTFVKINIQFT